SSFLSGMMAVWSHGVYTRLLFVQMNVVPSGVWKLLPRMNQTCGGHQFFFLGLGYPAMPPTRFIFCGNFSSAPYGKKQIKSLKGKMILSNSFFFISRFVFVPGPEDPGPNHITKEFRQRVPFCVHYEPIIQNYLVNNICRNCVWLPSSNLDIPNHFVKTILSQGHLTPLPLYVSPVFWAYDYALRVYPDPFNISNTDCLCINPGFTFKVHYPSNRKVEDSKLQSL
uniref:Polymerase (DNA directed), epsilon 2 n=1 Tax=Hucho hucho TaxID=62062 RepID=A0A4W5RE76_9TELE